MANGEPGTSIAARLRALLGVGAVAVALAAVLILPVAVLSGWLDRITFLDALTGSRATPQAKGSLDSAVQYVRALPVRTETLPLAVQGTHEGHWRFVNRSGEMFTVGKADEMKSVVAVLYPGAKANARLALYMTEDTVVRDRAALKALPAAADIHVVMGRQSYRVLRRPEGAGERFFVEVSPNLVVEMGERRLFEEAAFQLSRPLDQARVRVLALEPGGPTTLFARPRFDPATRRAQVDVIDPVGLAAAMGSVRGQTLLITGRIEGEALYVQPSSGAERSLPVKDLLDAARRSDVNLVVLQATPTPRQPGGRNWLWRSVEVQGVETALQSARLVDFLNALGSPQRRLLVSALPLGDRTALDLSPIADLAGATSGKSIGDVFATIANEITGRVIPTSVQANLLGAARQRELDRRIIPGVSTEVQLAYLLLIVVGLLGVPVSRPWWRGLWPPEVAGEYAGRTGYWAASAVRGLAFALVFLPLTAVAAAPCSLATQLRDIASAPARALRRLTGRKAPSPPALPVEPGGLPLPAPANNDRDWTLLDPASLRRRIPNR